MTRPRIAVLPGDGIGPEVTAVARRVLAAAGFEAEWSEHPVGWQHWCRHGEPLPTDTLAACRDADAILFGAITSKPDDEAEVGLEPALQGQGLRYRSPVLRLRQELDLWANVRPVRAPGIDLVVFRENTEGLYTGCETDAPGSGLREEFPGLPPHAAVSLRVITPDATRRICQAAFEHAERAGRRLVTLVEKANVLRATGGLVGRVFQEVAVEYPHIETEQLHIDAACARLVSDPGHFDVVVATNLFGDIFTDVAAAVAGGLPAAASANLGTDHALFEPVHGSAPDIAGRGIADPTGAVRAAAWMARHVGQADVADRIEWALAQVTHVPRATTAEHESVLLQILQNETVLV